MFLTLSIGRVENGKLPEEQVYTLKTFFTYEPGIPCLSDKVIFKNHAPPGRNYTVPNPKFLAIHAAIAHVLHTSGAGRALDLMADDTLPSSSAASSRPSSCVDFGGADFALRSSVSSLMASLHGTPTLSPRTAAGSD